jgi:hypothetical protein
MQIQSYRKIGWFDKSFLHPTFFCCPKIKVYGDTSVNVILQQWQLIKVRRAEDDCSEDDTSVSVILQQWQLIKVRRAEDDYSEERCILM